MTDKGKPEAGKIYKLTGATGEACIASGNTWSESEAKVDYEAVAAEAAANRVAEKNKLCEIPEFLKRSV